MLAWAIVVGEGEAAYGQDAQRVVAEIGGQDITQAEVDFQLGRVPDREWPELSFATLQATIQLIAWQRQALQTLRVHEQTASVDDVDDWILQQDQGMPAPATVADFVAATCKRWNIDERTYRDLVEFRLSWRIYVSRHLNPENLQKHFSKQQRRFDGTRFQIDLLSRPSPAGDSPQRLTAAQELTDVRQRIVRNDITWDEAFNDLRREPGTQLISRQWVRGTGDLEPSLVDVLIEMAAEQDAQPPQLSEVIHSASGVHLIRMHEIEFGTLQLEAVRDEVRAHMLVHMLQHLAQASQEALPLHSR